VAEKNTRLPHAARAEWRRKKNATLSRLHRLSTLLLCSPIQAILDQEARPARIAQDGLVDRAFPPAGRGDAAAVVARPARRERPNPRFPGTGGARRRTCSASAAGFRHREESVSGGACAGLGAHTRVLVQGRERAPATIESGARQKKKKNSTGSFFFHSSHALTARPPPPPHTRLARPPPTASSSPSFLL
jgi:hypothetical protein